MAFRHSKKWNVVDVQKLYSLARRVTMWLSGKNCWHASKWLSISFWHWQYPLDGDFSFSRFVSLLILSLCIYLRLEALKKNRIKITKGSLKIYAYIWKDSGNRLCLYYVMMIMILWTQYALQINSSGQLDVKWNSKMWMVPNYLSTHLRASYVPIIGSNCLFNNTPWLPATISRYLGEILNYWRNPLSLIDYQLRRLRYLCSGGY
jgi:hypothetical protein